MRNKPDGWIEKDVVSESDWVEMESFDLGILIVVVLRFEKDVS